MTDKLTDENVVNECYSMLSRLEAALEGFRDTKLYELDDRVMEWHEIALDFIGELQSYIYNKEN